MNNTKDAFAVRASVSCPACEKADVFESWHEEDFEHGVGDQVVTLRACVPVCTCNSCGLEFTDYRAEDLRHEAVCRYLKLLTPAEISAIRERYDLSQQAFAEISRFGRASLARWESGSLFQSASADNLLYLLSFPENIARLKKRWETESVDNQAQRRTDARFRSLGADSVARYRSEAVSFRLHLDA